MINQFNLPSIPAYSSTPELQVVSSSQRNKFVVAKVPNHLLPLVKQNLDQFRKTNSELRSNSVRQMEKPILHQESEYGEAFQNPYQQSKQIASVLSRKQQRSDSQSITSSSKSEFPLMLSQTERRKFTQKELSEPAILLEHLQRRVAVLESLQKKKTIKEKLTKQQTENLEKQKLKTQQEQRQRAQELQRQRMDQLIQNQQRAMQVRADLGEKTSFRVPKIKNEIVRRQSESLSERSFDHDSQHPPLTKNQFSQILKLKQLEQKLLSSVYGGGAIENAANRDLSSPPSQQSGKKMLNSDYSRQRLANDAQRYNQNQPQIDEVNSYDDQSESLSQYQQHQIQVHDEKYDQLYNQRIIEMKNSEYGLQTASPGQYYQTIQHNRLKQAQKKESLTTIQPDQQKQSNFADNVKQQMNNMSLKQQKSTVQKNQAQIQSAQGQKSNDQKMIKSRVLQEQIHGYCPRNFQQRSNVFQILFPSNYNGGEPEIMVTELFNLCESRQDELSWQQQQLQRQLVQLNHPNRLTDQQQEQEHVIKVYDRNSKGSKILSQVVMLPCNQTDNNDDIEIPQAADLTGKYQLGHTGGSRINPNSKDTNSASELVMQAARDQGANSESGQTTTRKKKKKEIIQLPKMKIIVKSTKTISFDGQFEDSSESDNQSEKNKQAKPNQEVVGSSSNNTNSNAVQQLSKDCTTPIAVEPLISIHDATLADLKKTSLDPHRKSEELNAIQEEDLDEVQSKDVNKSDGDFPIFSSSESSAGKDNKDILGMLIDDENQTDFMCEE